jgi:carboxymethylenebutenolidase
MMDAYTNETRTRGFAVMQKVDHDEAMLDVGAAADSLSAAGKVAVIGFCFGGRLAWLAASRVPGISAAVSYYGGGIPAWSPKSRAVRLFFISANSTKHIPVDAVREFGKAHPTLPVYIYPADHGFNCEQRGS